MDHDTKDIVHMGILDKRMTKGNSPMMEKEALRQALQSLTEKDLTPTELVTDANVAVAAMMSKYMIKTTILGQNLTYL